MDWLDRLEKKFGKFTIPHLIRYIVLAKATVVVLSLIWQFLLPDTAAQVSLYEFLVFSPAKVLKGEVWRILTFFVAEQDITSFSSLLLKAVSLYFYYFLGQTLENHWGTFKFNFYFFSSALFSIIGAFFIYFVLKVDLDASGTYVSDAYIYEALFFAFATLFPNVVVRIFFFIPIKVKWIGIISAGILVFNMVQYAFFGLWQYDVYILIGLSAYFIFFVPYWIQKIKNKQRASDYQHRATYNGGYTAGTRTTTTSAESGRSNTNTGKAFHRCYICGITEKDDPNMIFRYCSQCNGTYEYCSNHINNHIHIQ